MRVQWLISGFVALTGPCIIWASCGRSVDRRVAGEAAGQVIYVDEVDDLIQNSLYEYLFAIFDARSIATNELINSRLLEIEARTRGLTIDSLLSIETARIGKVETKSKYIRDNALHGGVIEEKSPFKVHQPDSEIGKKILDNSYRKFLKVRFIETLRAKYKTKVLLARPQPPAIGLDDVRIYARGNENSKTCITIVSDFDCSACRRAYPEFRKVFERYRDQVRFEAVNLSQNVTWAILLAECAGEQGNFWNAYEALYSENYHRTDRDSLIRILGLNRNECIACLESSRMNSKITTSMAQLHSCGIEVTPTVLIDRRTYYGPLESGAIGRFLDDLLLQKQND